MDTCILFFFNIGKSLPSLLVLRASLIRVHWNSALCNVRSYAGTFSSLVTTPPVKWVLHSLVFAPSSYVALLYTRWILVKGCTQRVESVIFWGADALVLLMDEWNSSSLSLHTSTRQHNAVIYYLVITSAPLVWHQSYKSTTSFWPKTISL